jgi:hypothetical protein
MYCTVLAQRSSRSRFVTVRFLIVSAWLPRWEPFNGNLPLKYCSPWNLESKVRTNLADLQLDCDARQGVLSWLFSLVPILRAAQFLDNPAMDDPHTFVTCSADQFSYLHPR